MAVPNTLFVAFSLMFLEAHSRSELRGTGDSLGTFKVSHVGQDFFNVGSPIVLPCGIQISPSQVVDHGWRKGRHRVTHRQLTYLDLQLDSTPEDEGEYRCFVQTGFGTILGPVHIVVKPVLTSSDEVFVEGYLDTNIVLNCPILSVPSGEVTWISPSNNTIEPGHARYKQLNSGNLLILTLHPQDSGRFQCLVRNWILNLDQSSTVHLSLTSISTSFGPSILETFPTNLTLSRTTQEFYCVGNGFPAPQSSWSVSYTAPEDLFITHPQTDHTSLGNRLWLNKENSSAKYDCVVSVGSEQIFKSMDTHVPPSFPNLPDLKYPAAKTVRFECKSTATPLLWYKNGELLETNSGRVKSRKTELVISNTVTSDSGVYQCEAGKYMGTGRLVILTSLDLSPPLDLVCSLSSSRAIQLGWKVQAEDTDRVQAFSIHFMPISGGVESQKVTDNTNFLLESLLPNTNYSIYVRAYSNKTASPQSQRVFCSTSEEGIVPLEKPSALQFHVIGNNSVLLTWVMPAGTVGQVISYAVEVTTSIHHKNESSVILTNSTSVTLENLTANTNYFVRVMAETTGGVGLGEYSSTIVFRISNHQNQTLNGNSSTTGVPGSTTGQDPGGFSSNEHNLGLILGITLGILSIIICGTIIICRNQCFAFFVKRGQRTRRGSYVTAGTSGKDTVDSAPLEMKELAQHLDTKGGHPNINGGVLDPLVGPEVRSRSEDEGQMSTS